MNVIAETRALTGLTRSELAALADIPPSTITRIETGAMTPTVTMMERIVGAMGYRTTLEAVGDSSAIAAVRSLLDPNWRGGVCGAATTWIERWSRARLVSNGAVNDPRQICLLAGLSAPLAARQGAVRVDALTWRILGTKLGNAGISYALTGSAALNRLAMSGSEPWTVAYVADAAAAMKALGTRYAPNSYPGGYATIIPFDGLCEVGRQQSEDGFWWAAPIQVVIDGYAGLDRMPDQADIVCDAFDAAVAAS